jgi:hypothetical protein
MPNKIDLFESSHRTRPDYGQVEVTLAVLRASYSDCRMIPERVLSLHEPTKALELLIYLPVFLSNQLYDRGGWRLSPTVPSVNVDMSNGFALEPVFVSLNPGHHQDVEQTPFAWLIE